MIWQGWKFGMTTLALGLASQVQANKELLLETA